MTIEIDEEAGSSTNVLRYAEPTEGTPLMSSRSEQHLSSQPKTFANIFIAIVGAGVLGLPYTFKRTGWVFGILMILLVAFLTYYCMMLLVKTRRMLESRRQMESSSRFNGRNGSVRNNSSSGDLGSSGRKESVRINSSSGDLGLERLGRNEPVRINSFGDLGFIVCGRSGRLIVDFMILFTQAGFCVSYLIFVANTLAHLTHTKKVLGFSPKSVYIWSCFPFQLGLNSIPTLTHLAPLSIFADVVDIGAMGVVMVEDWMIYTKSTHVLEAFGGISVVAYGMGVAVYAFEGIGMVLPLESETRDRGVFGRNLLISMGFISIMYIAFGVLGYMAFGEDTKDIITTNLGEGWVSTLVQLGLCINLFFTFPLMMNPVYEVCERRFSEGRYCIWMRWALVLAVSLVALLVPNFADFLSLVGSMFCVTLGFILPCLFHLIAFRDEIRLGEMIFDIVIMVLGVILAVAGTVSAVVEIFFSVKV